ncbi:hypothetical protein ACB092_03G099600 [Castanea dentata]
MGVIQIVVVRCLLMGSRGSPWVRWSWLVVGCRGWGGRGSPWSWLAIHRLDLMGWLGWIRWWLGWLRWLLGWFSWWVCGSAELKGMDLGSCVGLSKLKGMDLCGCLWLGSGFGYES